MTFIPIDSKSLFDYFNLYLLFIIPSKKLLALFSDKYEIATRVIFTKFPESWFRI